MCGRFTLTTPADQIQDLFGVKKLPELRARYNVAPTDDVLAVRKQKGDGGNQAVMLRWGLVPYWADDLSIGSRLINARSETVDEKPAFRSAFERRRCLIVADGFFEWTRANGKQPYHIVLKERGAFAFAGLWERWKGGEDGVVESCTILTTDANELVAPLHDRMPVILHATDHDLWLDTRAGREAVARLFEPFPADEMDTYAVSRRVNNVANDDEACLEPVETQQELF